MKNKLGKLPDMQADKIIETENMSLKEWLALIERSPKNTFFIDYSFPSEEVFQEYLTTITERSEKEVVSLIRRFLIHSVELGGDQHNLEFFLSPSYKKLNKTIHNFEYHRRLVFFASKKSTIPPWEGITWALDLLPAFPKMALEAVNAYFLAHAQLLPDGRLIGLSHAMALIRAKYILFPRSDSEAREVLLSLDPRSFEHLVERLYCQMGYKTELTPAARDGGRDVLGEINEIGKSQRIFIECKRYSKPVGVEFCRSLLGVVSDSKVNKGILITSFHFTRGAKAFSSQNPRLELVDGADLVLLLNENFGPRWPVNIDRMINESRLANAK